jgi:tetratricopeptide (TPR) repeat protein
VQACRRRRRAAKVAVCGLAALAVTVWRAGPQGFEAAPRVAAGPTMDFNRLFDEYANEEYGGRDQIQSWLVQQLRQADYPSDPRFFQHLVASWRQDWRPLRATFLLEVARAVAAIPANPARPLQPWTEPDLFMSGVAYLASRPVDGGTRAASDAFEMLWHRAALGLLERGSVWGRGGVYDGAQQYLDMLAARYRAAGAHIVDSRMALAAAVVQSKRCCRAAFLAELEDSGQDVAGHLGVAAQLDTAIAAFRDVANAPEVRQEALTRGAFLLIHRGKSDEALHWLEQIDPANPDRELLYWANLFRGRALDAMKRYSDAERAFRTALDAWPHGESAQTGLAADLMRLGRGADAEDVANDALAPFRPLGTWTELAVPPPARAVLVSRQRADPLDPWNTYEDADYRFVSGWLDALREESR